MRTIGKIFSFEAAHRLPHHIGQCKNLHGHSYRLEVEVTGPLMASDGPDHGMVMDFGELSQIVENEVISTHDHADLNTIYVNPTAEIMVREMAFKIDNHIFLPSKLTMVKLWETEKCYAIWREDQGF